MIEIKNKKDCCGCNACGDICPTSAISFKVDEEGFWYPEVHMDKCINCHLCEKICPNLNIHSIRNRGQHYPKVIGCHHKNITIRFDSTSGGVFSALANAMYKEGGYVSGAVQNEDFSVSNYISNNKRDLARLRSSKYLQSNAEGLYKQIRELLRKGEKVLACGSPCQMAGLRGFLGTKDYDNLIIVDFLCRATNSPKVYKKYLESLEKKFGSKVVYVKAKNKEHGWRSLARKVVFENGKEYFGEGHDDDYRRGYHWNMYERPSCYDCKFKTLPRIADITLADFWGIEKIDPSLDKNLGTSMVLLNTEKGEKFFEKIKSKLEWKEFEPKVAFRDNLSVIMEPIKYPPIDRAAMFADLDKMDFSEVAQKYFPNTEGTSQSFIKRIIRRVLSIGWHSLKSPTFALKVLRCVVGFVVRNMKLGYLWRIFRWNILRKNTITKRGLFIPKSYVALDLHPSAKIIVNNGKFEVGVKRNRYSKQETRLLLEKDSVLEVDGRNFIKSGSDIQVFKGAKLHFKSGATNMGLQIVCAKEITFGEDVHIGRDVWIRDNNGGHSIIQTGYTDCAPVHIGDHVWISSNVSITKGVTIGNGAVIAANSVVKSNIPPRCIASGNPAVVIAENIYWRP